MKTLVVYYSRFGSTAQVAQGVAQALGAELRKLELARWCTVGSLIIRTFLRRYVPLKPLDVDWKAVDRVVACAPVWAGRPANPLLSFLRHAPLENKEVAVLLTTGGRRNPGARAAIEEALRGRNVRLTKVDMLSTTKVSLEELRQQGAAWAQGLAR